MQTTEEWTHCGNVSYTVQVQICIYLPRKLFLFFFPNFIINIFSCSLILHCLGFLKFIHMFFKASLGLTFNKYTQYLKYTLMSCRSRPSSRGDLKFCCRKRWFVFRVWVRNIAILYLLGLCQPDQSGFLYKAARWSEINNQSFNHFCIIKACGHTNPQGRGGKVALRYCSGGTRKHHEL